MNKLIDIIKKIKLAVLALTIGLAACNNYLNVVPDEGEATLEMSFNLRSTAIRYLGTCYSYMTEEGASQFDPALLGGDELWDLVGRQISNTTGRVPSTMFQIARGLQNPTSVYADDWAYMYQGIRCCDILMENIDAVPDMQDWEKKQWKAEVKFLKAYFHFNLIRKWGPIPIVRESLPIDSSVEEVRVFRNPVDECFDYVVELLDEAIPDLPEVNPSETEYGRVNQIIATALKARVLVYAASPLFNNNVDQASLVDSQGTQLFPQGSSEAEQQKLWEDAMVACKNAIDLAEQNNRKLYIYDKNEYRLNDTLTLDFTLRGMMCDRWNQEIIWGNTQSNRTQRLMWQQLTAPNLQYKDLGWSHSLSCYAFIGVPLKIAEQFYTRNGLPLNFDKDRQGIDEFSLRKGDAAHSYYLEEGYTTIQLHFDREPRFYASLGFDGGKWVGALANYNDLKPGDIYTIENRMGKALAKTSSESGPVTGYYPKKMYPYQNRMGANQSALSTYWYPWPMIRLTDLYLLYAEAINEAEGPNGAHSADMFKYINAVRERAGIPDVKTSWDVHSTSPGRYNTKAGMRDIIHRERLNELAFESQRFWDLRRWKEANSEYSKNIYGFRVVSATPEEFYTRVLIAEQPFAQRDYFWPIQTTTLEKNPNLIQNLGW